MATLLINILPVYHHRHYSTLLNTTQHDSVQLSFASRPTALTKNIENVLQQNKLLPAAATTLESVVLEKNKPFIELNGNG